MRALVLNLVYLGVYSCIRLYGRVYTHQITSECPKFCYEIITLLHISVCTSALCILRSLTINCSTLLEAKRHGLKNPIWGSTTHGETLNPRKAYRYVT
jgi:hypothetical protein